MQKLFHFAVLAVSFLALAGATQASLEYYGVESFIQDNETVSHTITFRFAEDVRDFSYRIGADASNLSVESRSPAECRFEGTGITRGINCRLSGSRGSLLELKFDTKGGIKQIDGKFVIDASYFIALPTNTSFILVRLPPQSVLSEAVANESFLPADGNTLTDGRHIMVYWERENLNAGDVFNARVSYTTAKPSIIVQSELLAIIPILLLVIVAIAGGSFIYIRKHPRTKQLMAVLNEDEKRVVDILNTHGGKALQKQIVREGDFSKAKVTRLIKSLKERNVIEIEPVSGRENRIILKIKAG